MTGVAPWTGRQSSRIKASLAVNRATCAMSETEFQFTCLTDPRLAAHALSPTPAWLWSTDGTSILWANPNGAAIFEATSAAALAAARFRRACRRRTDLSLLAHRALRRQGRRAGDFHRTCRQRSQPA